MDLITGPDVKEATMEGSSALQELEAIKEALAALSPLDQGGRERAVTWIASALGVTTGTPSAAGFTPGGNGGPNAGLASQPGLLGSAKQFLAQKAPRSDIERVAVLAYFLTHAKGSVHFKTADISTLNVEAAGPRISNASYAVSNAMKKAGYLAAGPKGTRQITARGEALVEALPDHEAAKAAVNAMPGKPRRTAPRKQRTSKESS
jgi:hypothetical protein